MHLQRARLVSWICEIYHDNMIYCLDSAGAHTVACKFIWQINLVGKEAIHEDVFRAAGM